MFGFYQRIAGLFQHAGMETHFKLIHGTIHKNHQLLQKMDLAFQ
jgi:hypothetical protein